MRAEHRIMATLNTSLRRVLVILFFTASAIVLLLYWTQSSDGQFMGSSTFDKLNLGIKILQRDTKTPIEKAWTYKCVNDNCVRHHYVELTEQNAGPRIPYKTCAMTCGSVNIWPLPTRYSKASKKSVTFAVNSIKYSISSVHPEPKELIQNAFYLFMHDLHFMQNQEDIDDTSDRTKDAKEHSDTNVENDQNLLNTKCDINKIDLKITISKYPDVIINLQSDESYNLTINHDNRNLNIDINAKSFFGARHGLATLQQLIWYDDEVQSLRILNKAFIDDAPSFNYRGLMLDTSRHYFSVEAIKRTLIGMAHSKLNRFHWHITDSQSFPFQSKNYPQMSEYGAYSSSEIYTHDDIKEIVQFAKVRGIQIIPEIDAPAHAGNGWDWGPKRGLGELSLCINQQPWSMYCGEPPCGQLNPKNNNTYSILQSLYSELLELTGPTDYFHLGGDEVNLECWAQHFNDSDLRALWCDFMLQAFQRLVKANNNVAPSVVSVWSSGLTASTCLSTKNFVVQVWGASSWQENYDLISNGFRVIISHVDAWYLDCGFGSWRSTGEGACSPYTVWQKVYKHRPWERMQLSGSDLKLVLGGEACLWTEQVDESILDTRLWPRAAALAERLWTDPVDKIDSDVFSHTVFSRMSVFRDRLVELGLNAEPIFPKYCAQNQAECM